MASNTALFGADAGVGCVERDHFAHSARTGIPVAPNTGSSTLTVDSVEVRRRIATLVESVQDDKLRSHQLFQYVWTMVCVRRGLMSVVREVDANGATHVVVEEVRSGKRRLVPRPPELDSEVEALAVRALARILG